MTRLLLISLAIVALTLTTIIGDQRLWSADWPGSERRLVRLPHTEAELRAAHEQAAAFAAEMVPARRSFECLDGSEHVLVRVDDREIKLPCNRRGLIAMGSDMLQADQQRLPFFSGGIILDEVNAYFLSIQIRAAMSPTGAPYLVDRPLVALTKYAEANKTFPSTEIVDTSVRDIRSLGFLTRGEALPHDPPRTLAIAIRNLVAVSDPTGVDKIEPHYECVFMHAQVDPTGRALVTHAFGTTNSRTKLHRFTPIGTPKKLTDCAIQGSIFFTSYAFGGQYPTAKATRMVKLNTVTSIDVPQVDRWLAERGVQGDTWSHLPMVFDALIDGTLKP